MDGGTAQEPDQGPQVVSAGEFAGWSGWTDDAFEALTGPFYFREEENGQVRCAFRAEKRHMNGGGAMHGGCMLTFADFCLFALSRPQRQKVWGEVKMVTVSLNGEFVGPAFAGELIEATGEVVRAGGALMFLRGLALAAGRPMLAFSGVVKKVASAPPKP